MKINKSSFVKQFAKENNVPSGDAKLWADAIFGQLVKSISENDVVSIRGFGKFSRIIYQEKGYRHPKTGEMMTAPAHAVIKFTPSVEMLGLANEKAEESGMI